MEEYENRRKIIELFRELEDETKQQTLLEMLNDGVIDLASAMVVYARHLTQYKENAQVDMITLSRCGLDLAEKVIKAIPTIKSLNAKQLKTAQAYTLLSTGAYDGTKFGDDLKERVDMSIVNIKWYEQSWKLKAEPEKGPEHEHN